MNLIKNYYFLWGVKLRVIKKRDKINPKAGVGIRYTIFLMNGEFILLLSTILWANSKKFPLNKRLTIIKKKWI